jgi:nucleoside-diphosphate-sugar epimerase
MTTYEKSKFLAEKAAWDFVNHLASVTQLEFVTLLPGYALGPLLDSRYRPSSELVRKLMYHEIAGVARIKMAFTDVRDIASAHLLAMTTSEAAGERFNCVGGLLWMREIAQILDEHLSSRGYKIPRREMPDTLVRFRATYDHSVRLTLKYLGNDYDISTAKIRQTLGWQPRSEREAIISMADSLIALQPGPVPT